MAVKKIPNEIKEYLERKIVRGSRGYEPMERILSKNTDTDLQWFLEFYEKNLREELLEASSVENESGQEDLLGSSLQKIMTNEEEPAEDKLFGLVKNLGKE
tara:strand:- start:1846 stop:2148 length:303 start_codon:yes stop_codon:yes gene_type:complete